MQTTPVNADTLSRSAVAVPPLARHADLLLNAEENVRMIQHLESGGITALLYGGNANFYNVSLAEYADLLGFLEQAAGPDTVVIPSVGPAYGTMMDQAAILRDTAFPTAMILPAAFASTSAGVATGVRHFVEKSGKPAVLYIKSHGFIDVPDVKQLFDDGLLSVIKYAIVQDDTADDSYLRELAGNVDPKRIMSGIGEQPAIIHLRDFGLGGFTSGCVCVAPRLTMDMLEAIQAGDFENADRIRTIFRPLEDLRNTHSPIRVLHEAVRLAGIADTGPILPLLTNLDESLHCTVEAAARALLDQQVTRLASA